MRVVCIAFPLLLATASHALDELEMCGCSTEMIMCPANSSTVGAGATSVDDCVCNQGFVRIDANCVQIFECPLNSNTTAKAFALSIEDCVCNPGYARPNINGTCELQAGTNLVTLISGIAAAGGVVLLGGAWTVSQLFFFSPSTTLNPAVVASTGTKLDPAAFSLNGSPIVLSLRAHHAGKLVVEKV